VTNATGGLGIACAALPAGSLTGKIALLSRGTCSFSTKIRTAQAAGALAVLVVNNAVGDPITMAQDGTPNQPAIPTYMLSQSDGSGLAGDDGATTTISGSLGYFQTANADFMADLAARDPFP